MTQKHLSTFVGAGIIFAAVAVSGLATWFVSSRLDAQQEALVSEREEGRQEVPAFSLYEIKDDAVYCYKELLEGADPVTFEALSDGYAKDVDTVFLDCLTINGADPETFELIGKDYGRDKDNVYFWDAVIKDADPATFIILEGPEPGRWGTGADRREGYGKDHVSIYFGDSLLEGADVATFESLGSYAKDKDRAYFADRRITGADSATFELISSYYAKDKAYVFYADDIVQGVDVMNFQDKGAYATDGKSIYIDGRYLPKLNIDVETFTYVGEAYYKDNNAVFMYIPDSDAGLIKMEGIDPSQCAEEDLSKCKANVQ